MKRRSIFGALAALFGGQVARGQEGYSVASHGYTRLRLGSGGNALLAKDAPPEPNECPVCGTIADPYVRQTEVLAYKNFPCTPVPSDGTNALAVCRTPSETVRVGPMERVTRCKRCNAAFWQDAKE
jgi:hypothetical protein